MPESLTTATEALDALRAGIRRARHQGLKPPPHLTVPAWADEHRRLARESGSTGGRWETSRVEVARGPMLAVTEPGVRTITVMSCTQLMKTALMESVIGYFAHTDPCPMLLVEPKDEAVLAFSKERLAPMIAATPVLRDLVGDRRVKTADDTQTFKRFPGGFIAMVAAGSPTNLAMRAIRVTLCDEVDKYPPTKEGDPVTLAEERTATFPTNSLSIRACSPTEEGASRIEASYAASDQRRAFVPCPHCGHEQALDFFRHVHWEKGEEGEHRPDTARVVCEACGVAWEEAERLDALAGIRWRQTRPFTCCGEKQSPIETREWRWDEANAVGRAICRHCGADAVPAHHAGFQASKLYSPWRPVSEIAAKWLDAKDDPEQRRAFVNTQLGLPYRIQAEKQASAAGLLGRREVYEAEVPDGVAVLVAGVDTQDDRLEVEIVGWGRDLESWSIGYLVLPGSPGRPEVWNALDDALAQTYRDARGRAYRIEAAAIDTGGHHTQKAYEFCAARFGRRVWPIKGESARGAKRSPVWPRKVRRPAKGGKLPPFVIGVNAAKDAVHEHLGVPVAGPGYCHFPHDRDAEYFEQLTAERLVARTHNGTRSLVWEPKRAGLRNEAWDCRIYAYAALCGLIMGGLRLNAYADRVAERAREAEETPPEEARPSPALPPAPPAHAPPARGDWLGGRRSNWLKR